MEVLMTWEVLWQHWPELCPGPCQAPLLSANIFRWTTRDTSGAGKVTLVTEECPVRVGPGSDRWSGYTRTYSPTIIMGRNCPKTVGRIIPCNCRMNGRNNAEWWDHNCNLFLIMTGFIIKVLTRTKEYIYYPRFVQIIVKQKLDMDVVYLNLCSRLYEGHNFNSKLTRICKRWKSLIHKYGNVFWDIA